MTGGGWADVGKAAARLGYAPAKDHAVGAERTVRLIPNIYIEGPRRRGPSGRCASYKLCI